MKTDHNNSARAPRGFTLVELLVVIGVLVLLLTVAAPNLKGLLDSEQVANGINAVTRAVAEARANAPLAPPMRTGFYSGTAIIATPQGELRIVRHVDSSSLADGSGTLGSFLSTRTGFEDIPGVNYIKLPKGVGLVGITRGGSGSGELQLLAPPFAMRFNPRGMMLTRHGGYSGAEADTTYYDGNLDGRYTVSDFRGTSYDPEAFDPEHRDYTETDNVNWAPDPVNKHLLAFDGLENVAGVLVYDKNQLWEAFPPSGTDTGGIPDGGEETTTGTFGANTVGRWLIENGAAVYFNRYTGSEIQQ